MKSRSRSLSLAACAAVLVAASLAAQGPVGPGILRAKRDTPGLGPSKLGVASVLQVHMVRHPGDAAGVWTCAMSVTGLKTSGGGKGGMDLLYGKYDATRDFFQPGSLPFGFNTSGDEFSAMLEPTGKLMVFERIGANSSTVYLARRTTPSGAFGAPVALKGLPVQSGYDPAIGNVHGRTRLFYRLGTGLYYSSIDMTTGIVSPDRILVVGPAKRGSRAHSPTPVFDPAGEVVGLSHHDVEGSDSDQFMSFDLDPFTPSIPVMNTSTWINNGGFAGGRFFTAESSPGPHHVVDFDTVWMSGTRASVGGIANVCFFAPPASSGAPRFANLLLSGAFLPLGVAVPGIGNELGLSPAGFLAFPVGLVDPRTGRATLRLKIPNQLGLLGTTVPAQGLIAGGNRSTFTNTTTLRVDPIASRRTLSFPYDGRDHLLSRVNPALPTMLRASAGNRAPFKLLAKDARGAVIPGAEIEVSAGHTAALHVEGAASYVARMPKLAGLGGGDAKAEEDIGELVVDTSSNAACLCDDRQRHIYGTNIKGTYKVFVRAHDGKWNDSLCDVIVELQDNKGKVLQSKRIPAGGAGGFEHRKVDKSLVHFFVRCARTGVARSCIYIVGIRRF